MRWIVLLDGELDQRCRTRAEAREHARWLRRHPAVRDRQRFGHGGHVCIRRAAQGPLHDLAESLGLVDVGGGS